MISLVWAWLGKGWFKRFTCDPNVQQGRVTDTAAISPASCFGLLLPKNPDQWATSAFSIPPSFTNVRISSDSESHPWHYGCLFCFSSVGSCLIFNFSGPQYHLSNGDSKTQFQGLFGTLHMIMWMCQICHPNLMSQGTALPLYAAPLVAQGHPAAWSRAHV